MPYEASAQPERVILFESSSAASGASYSFVDVEGNVPSDVMGRYLLFV